MRQHGWVEADGLAVGQAEPSTDVQGHQVLITQVPLQLPSGQFNACISQLVLRMCTPPTASTAAALIALPVSCAFPVAITGYDDAPGAGMWAI